MCCAAVGRLRRLDRVGCCHVAADNMGVRMILLVNSGGEAAVPEWQAEFRAVAPHLDVRWWQDPGMDLAEVAYVFVWSLTPG